MYDAVDQDLVLARPAGEANGTIPICGDYSTGSNAALQPNQYNPPLSDDICAKLANCEYLLQRDRFV